MSDCTSDPIGFNKQLAEPTVILADRPGSEMREWDRNVAPRLFRAQSYAAFAVGDAREIMKCINGLPILPSFETKAIDAIDTAIRDVRDALFNLERAREEYSKKPVAAA